jgi:outer membrane protein TolC
VATPPETYGTLNLGDASSQEAGAAPRVSIALAGAIQRAREYGRQFLEAATAAGVAREDRVQARAALLPALTALSQYIYTQGNGTPTGVFVANNGVHVYNEQAIVHADLFSFSKLADYRRAQAAEAAARARQEIAARGLIATVVQAYYGVATAERHEANARRSADEAQQFLDITRKQEQGGEAAHADVVKADLQHRQRQRDLTDAAANTAKARITLAVMIFADPEQPFRIEDDLGLNPPLAPLVEIRAAALSESPEIREAEAALRQSKAAADSAKYAYYPSLGIDYLFGIDANSLSVRGPEGQRNLGSSVEATISVPLWNWGATRSKVRQAELERRQAEFDVAFERRALQSNLASSYLEAQTASQELDSLRDSLDLSTESLRLALLRYEAGEASALEVVDAQSALAQARNAYDDGLARYRIGLANVRILTGRF